MTGERRRARRRSLPFVRSAILSCGNTAHIVILNDLSREGAFLTTRMPNGLPEPQPGVPLRLRMVVPRHSREVAVPCELVWRNEHFDAATGRPSGMAVRFLEVPSELQQHIEEFAAEGFRPSAGPTPSEHFEYRILERSGVELSDLNKFGRDGWRLVTIVPAAPAGFKLVLVRRL